MTDPAPSPEAIPDVTAALPALLPEIRRETAQGWMLIAAVVIVAGLVLAALAGVDDEPLPWMAVIVVFAGLGVAEIARRVRRAHEATIMPILAETAGLQYS